MKRNKGKSGKFNKVVSERYPDPKRKGGGLIKIEVWENEAGEVVKYSIAYINHLLFAANNGRVLGYDNAHNYHHKHYFGDIMPVTDFINYQDLIERFEAEIKEFIQ